MNTIVKKERGFIMVEGTALPSKIYYRETGETRMWDDLTKKEKEEAMTIMATRVMDVLGYRLVEMKFED
jgi:hypothetical protein